MNPVIRWWHLHPRLRMVLYGFRNPFWPAPPWSPNEDPRWQKLLPAVRRYEADYKKAGGAHSPRASGKTYV